MNIECGYEVPFWIVILLSYFQQWRIERHKKLNIKQKDLIDELNAVMSAQQEILNDAGIQLIITKMKGMKK